MVIVAKNTDHWPAGLVWHCHGCGAEVLVHVPVRTAPSHYCRTPAGWLLTELDPFSSIPDTIPLDLGGILRRPLAATPVLVPASVPPCAG